MNRLPMIVGGAIIMVPAIAAPNAYMTRLGPKPLNFSAPPRPLEEVIAKLPALATDLPTDPIESSRPSSNFTDQDPFYLWPVPSASPSTNPLESSLRLPDNWVKSLLGPELSPTTSGESGNPTPEGGATIPTLRPHPAPKKIPASRYQCPSFLGRRPPPTLAALPSVRIDPCLTVPAFNDGFSDSSLRW
jgi:hypothetical protein